MGYQYLAQGHDPEAVTQLQQVVKIQPGDTISKQIIAQYQPGAAGQQPAESTIATTTAVEGKLAGAWTAAPSPDSKITLAIADDGGFTWTATNPGKPVMNITGKSSLANGLLTLAAQQGQQGALVGQVAWKDLNDFTFRLVGAAASDPGLKFSR